MTDLLLNQPVLNADPFINARGSRLFCAGRLVKVFEFLDRLGFTLRAREFPRKTFTRSKNALVGKESLAPKFDKSVYFEKRPANQNS